MNKLTQYNDIFSKYNTKSKTDNLISNTDLTNDKEECEHNFIKDYTSLICKECGLVDKSYTALTEIEDKLYDNTSKLSSYTYNATMISGGNYSLNKLNVWINNNNSYNFRKECFGELKQLIKINNLEDIKGLYSSSIDKLNQLYCDYNLRFRGEIKISIFIYTIYTSLVFLEKPINLIKMLENSNLTIIKYNHALRKITKEIEDYKVDFIPESINFYLEKGYPQYEVIQKYNETLELIKEKNYRKKKIEMLFNHYYILGRTPK